MWTQTESNFIVIVTCNNHEAVKYLRFHHAWYPGHTAETLHVQVSNLSWGKGFGVGELLLVLHSESNFLNFSNRCVGYWYQDSLGSFVSDPSVDNPSAFVASILRPDFFNKSKSLLGTVQPLVHSVFWWKMRRNKRKNAWQPGHSIKNMFKPAWIAELFFAREAEGPQSF